MSAARPATGASARALFVLVLSVYLLTASGHVPPYDVISELGVAQSMVRHGTFEAAPGTASVRGLGGRHYSPFGLGESLLLLPAALAGEWAPAAQARPVSLFVASLLNPLVAALAVVFLFALVLDLGFALPTALWSALLFGFATIQWPYAHIGFDVTPASTLLLGSLLALRRGLAGARRRWLAGSGAALGGALLVRPSSALWAPPLLAYLALASRPVERGRDVLAWSLPVAAAAALVGAYDLARFGTLLETGYGRMAGFGFTTPISAGLAGLLVSPGKGMFLFSPVLWLGLAGLPGLIRRERALGWTIVGISALNLLFFARFHFWHGDWCWGPRFTVPFTALALLPAAAVLERWSTLKRLARAAVVALVALSAAVQTLGVCVDYQLQMELQVERGAPPGRYWSPRESQLVVHARALWQVMNEAAEYPALRVAYGGRATRPPGNSWDFWWRYAWLSGYPRAPILAALALGIAAALAAGARLAAHLRVPGAAVAFSPGVEIAAPAEAENAAPAAGSRHAGVGPLGSPGQ